MSHSRHQNFRSFLTERFTAVAVEIFGEVESMVEAYYEENKRLRNILHMVINPEIKLPRIDESQCPGATADVADEPPDPNTGADMEIVEPKEEQMEHDISSGSGQQQQGLVGADICIATNCVKDEPEEEPLSMPCIAESFRIKIVEGDSDSTITVSADDPHDKMDSSFASVSQSGSVTDYPQVSRDDESENQQMENHNLRMSMNKKSRQSRGQKTMLELPRMTSYQSLFDDLPDTQSFLGRLTEAYKDMPEDQKPMIAKMGLTEDIELVDCAFGKVPKGCPLSYQCPVPSSQDYVKHDDAPLRPGLPLTCSRLNHMSNFPTLTAKEQEHMNMLHISMEAAHSLERSTRPPQGIEQLEEKRKLHLTNRFREICQLKPGHSNAEHMIFKIQKGPTRCKMAQIHEEMKTEALREYCRNLYVNWYPCGLVVQPSAPWLGAVPCGLVYEPKEKRSFGLVHVKCIDLRSYSDCTFLVCQDGVCQLKKNHSLFWHIQGEMMVTGMAWCDLLVISNEDLLVQRIYRDKVFINAMKEKLDAFFFYHYLPSVN